jgi:hypothetical protein
MQTRSKSQFFKEIEKENQEFRGHKTKIWKQRWETESTAFVALQFHNYFSRWVTTTPFLKEIYLWNAEDDGAQVTKRLAIDSVMGTILQFRGFDDVLWISDAFSELIKSKGEITTPWLMVKITVWGHVYVVLYHLKTRKLRFWWRVSIFFIIYSIF